MNSVKCDKIVEKGIKQVKLKDKEKSGKSPADSSFCKGALTIEQSIIMSINPIAFAARLLSGPEDQRYFNQPGRIKDTSINQEN